MPPAAPRSRTLTLETGASIAALALMALLPIVEVVLRPLLGIGVPGSIIIVQHLTLVLAFLGAALAARADRLLSLSTPDLLPAAWRPPVRLATCAIGSGVAAWLALASIQLMRAERQAGDELALGIPLWIVLLVMPLGLAAVAARLIARASAGWRGRALACCGPAAILAMSATPSLQGSGLLWGWCLLIAVATLMGLPLFAAIGGLAIFLFWDAAMPIASVPLDAYRLTAHPILPAVPLFTLSGFIMAGGNASDRLLRVFTALVGWLPGGTAIVTALVFAFFTSFTGASGVTILSLGGLLLPILVKSGYPEKFSLGLVTVSGSIGLLFPPSLPVILYAVAAREPIVDLFLGGLIPGCLLLGLVACLGVRQGLLAEAGRATFAPREAGAAVWAARWELILPAVVLLGIFGGYTTPVEAAALTVLYALVSECVIHREMSITRDIPRVLVECATLVGGFLIIVEVAYGLTDYLVLADVPSGLLEWVRARIDSPLIFLLVLNIFLLIVGALMDIYSAILVVVPLVAPMAAAYGIHPIHLGIIFLANLELGYLTPPMGENLFLSAYRFGHPVMRVFRSTLPFYAILLLGVLLITYAPWMTLGLLRLTGGG